MIEVGDTVIYGIEWRPHDITWHLAQVVNVFVAESGERSYRIRTRSGQALFRPAYLVRKPKHITSVSWLTTY